MFPAATVTPAATSAAAAATGSVAHEQIRSALRAIRAFNDSTATMVLPTWDASAAAAELVDGVVDLDDEMLVDPELVRNLVASGSADAIVAEQAAKALLRRRKHRENMIRYRHKKKMSFDDMRAEEQRLAAQLQRLLHAHIDQQQEQQEQLTEPYDPHEQQAVVAAQQQRAMGEFVDVLVEKEQLHHENVMLRRKLADFQKFQQAVSEANAQEEKEKRADIATQGKDGCGAGRWVRFLESDVPFFYEPFSWSECHDVAQSTLQKVFAHQCSYMAGNQARDEQVFRLFDWTAHLGFDWDETFQMSMIKYRFKKTFRNPQLSVQQLVDGEWGILHNAKLYQNIYRVPVHSQILQKVDDNMSIGIWNAPEPEKSLRFRNVSLFSRGAFISPEGRECGSVTITGVQLKNFKEQELQALNEFMKKYYGAAPADSNEDEHDEDGVEDDGRAVYTHGGYHYNSFAKCENGDIEVEFGGRVDCVSDDQGRFLMVELCGSCVRLEQFLFPSRVLSFD